MLVLSSKLAFILLMTSIGRGSVIVPGTVTVIWIVSSFKLSNNLTLISFTVISSKTLVN